MHYQTGTDLGKNVNRLEMSWTRLDKLVLFSTGKEKLRLVVVLK